MRKPNISPLMTTEFYRRETLHILQFQNDSDYVARRLHDGPFPSPETHYTHVLHEFATSAIFINHPRRFR